MIADCNLPVCPPASAKPQNPPPPCLAQVSRMTLMPPPASAPSAQQQQQQLLLLPVVRLRFASEALRKEAHQRLAEGMADGPGYPWPPAGTEPRVTEALQVRPPPAEGTVPTSCGIIRAIGCSWPLPFHVHVCMCV